MCCMGMLNGCMSSLGSLSLLHPLDLVINVSYGALWQKHVAWGKIRDELLFTPAFLTRPLLPHIPAAKPDGEELRHYITSRYSTNMVLLSLLLATEIHVFFNSSHELVQMRTILGTTPIAWNSLEFWTGLTILLDVCVTLMGLIATFTLWGMISAISDTNSHCLLRSSLGQYVTSLPPRFALASIYLFLLWILLFIIDLVVEPLAILLVALACIMFFSIVLPLSAFGRLIMHTGAMSQRPVLSADLEKDLLPSGLQASLLIRATHRQRRDVCVTTQYRRQAVVNRNLSAPRGATRENNTVSRSVPAGSDDVRLSSTDELGSSLDPIDVQGWLNPNSASDENESEPASQKRKSHRRLKSGDTISSEALLLPRASVLNATISRSELRELIESSLTTISRHPKADIQISRQSSSAGLQNNIATVDNSSNGPSLPPSHASGTIARPNAITKHHRRVSSAARGLLSEWVVESDVRDLYGARPPADLPEEIDIYEQTAQQAIDDNSWSPWRRTSTFMSFLHSPKDDEVETNTPPPRPTTISRAAARLQEEGKNTSLTQPLLPSGIAADDDESLLFGEEILQQSTAEKKSPPQPKEMNQSD